MMEAISLARDNDHDAAHGAHADGDTPTLRLFALLETIAAKDKLFSLQGLVEETGLPKPTLHRMLQQLEAANILQRDGDGRLYSTGARLRRLAENLLVNSSAHGARHSVLRRLVDEVGESCNITAFSGSEVLYLDRMETSAPLRFYLRSGSRVPAHCSASGKLFLSQLAPAQRRRLLAHAPLERFTDKTISDLATLELEIDAAKRNGYALDNEEFLPGLFCIAVPVPNLSKPQGRPSMGLAIQAPIMRMGVDKALQLLPALRRAAQTIAQINDEVPAHDA
jgi:IclR family transcriptional regulator, acetate operon repressor